MFQSSSLDIDLLRSLRSIWGLLGYLGLKSRDKHLEPLPPLQHRHRHQHKLSSITKKQLVLWNNNFWMKPTSGSNSSSSSTNSICSSTNNRCNNNRCNNNRCSNSRCSNSSRCNLCNSNNSSSQSTPIATQATRWPGSTLIHTTEKEWHVINAITVLLINTGSTIVQLVKLITANNVAVRKWDEWKSFENK